MSQIEKNFRFSLNSNEFVQNPYPIYRYLRNHDPVHFSSDGFYFITRHEDIKNSLTDLRLRNAPSQFSPLNNRNRELSLASQVSNNLISFMDPPDHSIPRKMISNSFQCSLAKSSLSFNSVAENLIIELKERKIFDFDEIFSIPFAVKCISSIVGLDRSIQDKLHKWSNMFFYLFHSIQEKETLAKVNSTIEEFRDVISFELSRRKSGDYDDLLSILCKADINGNRLDDEQIIDNVMLITADAIGNVHSGLTTAVSLILRHDDQLEKLKKNHELISSAIQECIRYETPAQFQGRIASETFEINGKKIRKNFVVLLALGSGNRDPEFLIDPDRFDIERKNSKDLSFGFGNHRCIGLNLVLAEFTAVFSSLFRNDLHFSLIDQEIEWISRSGHRWPKGMLLELK